MTLGVGLLPPQCDQEAPVKAQASGGVGGGRCPRPGRGICRLFWDLWALSPACQAGASRGIRLQRHFIRQEPCPQDQRAVRVPQPHWELRARTGAPGV